MAFTAIGESVERYAAEQARRETVANRLVARDQERKREKQRRRAKGVWVALANAGIHLTHDQHYVVQLVVRKHPELEEGVFTPAEAVERLISYGVPFTYGQLSLISEETTVSGRSSSSEFERRPRPSSQHPAQRKAAAVKVPRALRNLVGWLRRVHTRITG
jgi:hypothetical protein